MAAGAGSISSGTKHDCQGCPPFGALAFLPRSGNVEEATGELQTWPTVLTLHFSTCGVSRRWDRCQTLPLEDTFLSGLGLLRKSRIPPPSQTAPGYLSLHYCARFWRLQLHHENWGICLYRCAQSRQSLAISFHILTTAASPWEKHLNLQGTVNSPKSGTEQ